MKKNHVIIIAIILVLATVVVLANKAAKQSETVFLEKYGLSGLSVEEIVQKLDSTTSDPSELRASITSDNLILMDDSNEIKLALPKNEFYLSFAPYISQTHPCGTHSLSSCQGELVDKEIHTIITDREGNEIINSTLVTMENGFIGVWLPKNMDGVVTVNYDNMVAQAPISTYSGSNTCVTTLQLN